MRDPYEILTVSQSADDKELKRAFRRLARQYHPDVNQGDSEAEERFKEIQAAYALLSDPEKRRSYDSGEIAGDFVQTINFDDVDLSFVFSEIFGGGFSGGDRRTIVFEPLEQADLDQHIKLRVPRSVANSGTLLAAKTPDNRRVQFRLPSEVQDGTTLKLKNQGHVVAGQHGDLYVKIILS